MKLGETDPTKLRIPLTILDADGNLVPDFVPAAHELVTTHSGSALADAAGTLVQVGGVGSVVYYYQGTPADAVIEGFTGVAINRLGYRAFAWRPVVGAGGLTIFPFAITSGGALAPGCNPSGAGELQMSPDGAAFAVPTGTFGEMGLGYYYYRHDVANVDTPIIIKVNKAGFDLALAWGDAEAAEAGATGIAITGSGSSSIGASLSGLDELGDLQLVWSNTTGDADFALDGTDLATDRGLATALLLSLFLDRRANDDDEPPSGDQTDRRGWWADQFARVPGDLYGSRLWLLDRATLTNENKLRAKDYAAEALAWMIEDKVVKDTNVTAELTAKGILVGGVLERPGREPVPFLFSRVWDHVTEDI